MNIAHIVIWQYYITFGIIWLWKYMAFLAYYLYKVSKIDIIIFFKFRIKSQLFYIVLMSKECAGFRITYQVIKII
jgi:hypothetical protein